MSKRIGVDLRYDKCRLAAAAADGRADIILNHSNERDTPSAVARINNEWIIGKHAIELSARHPGTMVRDLLASGGDVSLQANGETYSPDDVMTALLRRLREDAELRMGDEVGESVFALPSDLNQVLYKRVRESAEKAGWPVRTLLPAYATVVARDIATEENQRLCLVLDWNGRHFIVTLLLAGAGGITHLHTSGNNRLGGSRFRDVIVDFTLEKIQEEYGVDGKTQPKFLLLLQAAATRAMWELISQNSGFIVVIGALKDVRGEVIDVDIDLTKEDYSRLISPLIKDALKFVESNVLTKMGVTAAQLDAIFLTGSTVNFPLVQSHVREEYCGDKIRNSVDPEDMVALGAQFLSESTELVLKLTNPDDPAAAIREHFQVDSENKVEEPIEAEPDTVEAEESGSESASSPGHEESIDSEKPDEEINQSAGEETVVRDSADVESEQPSFRVTGEDVPEESAEIIDAQQESSDDDEPVVVDQCEEVPAPTLAEEEPSIQDASEQDTQETTEEMGSPPEDSKEDEPSEPGGTHEEKVGKTDDNPEETTASAPLSMDNEKRETGYESDESQAFQLERCIFKDSHYSCYIGKDTQTSRPIRLRTYSASDKRARKLFARALMVNHIPHPNIEPMLAFDKTGDEFLLVSEGVDRISLRELTAEQDGGNKPIPIKSALQIAVCLCEALESIHSHGIFHRNVKPENIIVSPSNGRACLTGFEICVLLPRGHTDHTMAGTLSYMAPEMFVGRSDSRADLYSAAVVLYEMVTGKLPFKARTVEDMKSKVYGKAPTPPMSINPAVPPELNGIILRGLARNPGQRKLSAETLRNVLLHGPQGES